MKVYLIDHGYEYQTPKVVSTRNTIEEMVNFVNMTSDEDLERCYGACKEYCTIAVDVELRPNLTDESVVDRIKSYTKVGFYK